MKHKKQLIVHLVERFTAGRRLSARETQVVTCIGEGVVKSRSIAAALGISINTVSNHLKRIFEKTSCESKAEILAAMLHLSLEGSKDVRSESAGGSASELQDPKKMAS